MSSAIKTFPWGGELYLEIPLSKKSSNKFYARHGKTGEGREYIEFSKFGPVPNGEGTTYIQKFRLFSAEQWALVKNCVENELAASIGWDIAAAQKEFKKNSHKTRQVDVTLTPVAELVATALAA